MSIVCPQCNANLPEDAGLDYRFCPKCGAKINAMATDDYADIQTIPPDLNPDAETSSGAKTAVDENQESQIFTNHTRAPEVFQHRKPPPELMVPPGPPPSSFYRVNPADQYSNAATLEQKRTDQRRSVTVLWILVMAVVVLLAGGIYFTFWF